jgi:hypothetical protein
MGVLWVVELSDGLYVVNVWFSAYLVYSRATILTAMIIPIQCLVSYGVPVPSVSCSFTLPLI